MMNYDAKKINFTEIVKDVLLIEAGLSVSSLGTSLFYASNLGSSAMATFCDGLHVLLNTSYGSANTLANVVFFILLLILERKYIDIGTILCVFTIGPWVNFYTGLLSPLQIASAAMPIRILASVCGAILMGIGLGLYMAVGRGYGALEGIVKYATVKTSISVKSAKIIQDLVLSVSGILLKGAWGIGTVIGIFLIGPVLQASSEFFSGSLRKNKVETA